MITVKKSITRAVVSVIAAAVMVITSIASVSADNVYTSESGNQWSSIGDRNGCVHTVSEDGELTSTRTKFRNLGSGMYYEAVDGTWTALEDQTTSIPVVTSYWKASVGTISTGKAQAKFDFKFDGGAGQRFMFGWNGYNSNLGVRFQKTGAQQMRTTGAPGNPISATLEDNVWYTATIVLDLATGAQTVTVKNGSETVLSGGFTLGSAESIAEAGAITSLRFISPADLDYTNRNAETVTEVDYPASVWHIRNVSYDAYTETNYALASVYRSEDGITTNKAGEGFTLQGLELTRFTNFAVPANTRLITASYDTNKRMVDAEIKNIPEVGTTTIPVGVEGATTVKSFIFDMDTATPFVNAYDHSTTPTTTVRKWDFEEGFTETADVTGATVTKITEGGNNILKFERNIFGNNPYWKWDGSAWASTEDATRNFKQELLFDETVKSLTLSFKVKFEGNDNPSGNQAVDITFGTADKPFFLKRGFDGKVTVNNNYGGPWSSIGTIDKDVWYDVTLVATFGNTTDGSTFAWTIAKDGATVCESTTTIKSHDFSAGVDRVNIGSRRDQDTIGTSATSDATYTQTSSVWYIDDVVVEY